MASLLLLETATQVCSVAVSVDGEVVSVKEEIGQNLHASNLTLFIQQALLNAKLAFKDLDAVAISKGPGSYTGLRIGTSTAKGLCFALDVPLIAINTLEMMAVGFMSNNQSYKGLVCSMIDARRMEVYAAVFDSDLNELLPTEAKIIDEDSFSSVLKNHPIMFIGDGASKCAEILSDRNAIFNGENYNRAGNMAYLAENAYLSKSFEDVAYFEPYYLKDFLVTQSKKKLI